MMVPEFAACDDFYNGLVLQTPGLMVQVAVARGSRLLYNRAFGGAEPWSLFRIASISKPITALAILQLVEAGEASLDDGIVDVLGLEPVDERWRRIDLRHVLMHRAGFDRDVSGDPMFMSVKIAEATGTESPAMPAAIVSYILQQPLDFEPGERYAYSNFGYCLLGRVVERLSGQRYEEYGRREVLAPVGITAPRLGRTLPSHRLPDEVPYLPEGTTESVFPPVGEQVPNPDGGWCLEAMDSHGGWLATAGDLVRLAGCLDGADPCPILSPESVAQIWLPHAGKPDTEDTWYGLGWRVQAVEGGLNAWHFGALDGTSTMLRRRHDGLRWSVLFNKRVKEPGIEFAPAVDNRMTELVDEGAATL